MSIMTRWHDCPLLVQTNFYYNPSSYIVWLASFPSEQGHINTVPMVGSFCINNLEVTR